MCGHACSASAECCIAKEKRRKAERRTHARRSARVLVIASSQFFANPFARAAGGDEVLEQLAMPYAQQVLTNTILVARNMVEWMTIDDDLVACARTPNSAH